MAVWREGDVARAAAGGDVGGRRVVRRQFAFLRVVLVDHYLVQPEVADESEMVRRVQGDAVGVRPFLTAWVFAFSLVLHEIGGIAETALLVDGKDPHAAAAVVRGDKVLTFFVHDQMTRAFAHR